MNHISPKTENIKTAADLEPRELSEIIFDIEQRLYNIATLTRGVHFYADEIPHPETKTIIQAMALDAEEEQRALRLCARELDAIEGRVAA